jgi:DEAD/DEAH box helicase domain-containing protein
MTDKIVFDIETKNTFDDVGGQSNIGKLEASVIGTYSYATDTYRVFDEHEMEELGALIQKAHPLIGFYSKKFDVPVLAKYFNFNLAAIPHYDILEEIEKNMKRRIGLGVLAEANLGVGKSGHGLQAIDFYRNGEMQKLKDYCIQDVKLTKQIYDLIRTQGFLWIPDRMTSKMTKLIIPFTELAEPQAKLL